MNELMENINRELETVKNNSVKARTKTCNTKMYQTCITLKCKILA